MTSGPARKVRQTRSRGRSGAAADPRPSRQQRVVVVHPARAACRPWSAPGSSRCTIVGGPGHVGLALAVRHVPRRDPADVALHAVEGRVVGGHRGELQAVVGVGEPPQVLACRTAPPGAGAVEQVDLPACPAADSRTDLLDDGLDRGQAGAARDAQQVPRPGRLAASSCRAPGPGSARHRARVWCTSAPADPAAGDGLDVQADQPVVARPAGDRVRPPHLRPPRVCERDVLAGLVGQRPGRAPPS